MEEKTCAALVFTVLLLHSYVFLSTAASGRKLLDEVEDGMMVLARRMNAENRKDYVPVQANPRHDPSRDPDLSPPTDPHDIPPPPPQSAEPAPPVEADPAPHETTAPTGDTDRSSIYHHVHHRRHPGATQIQTPINDPAPPPIPTTVNHGV